MTGPEVVGHYGQHLEPWEMLYSLPALPLFIIALLPNILYHN